MLINSNKHIGQILLNITVIFNLINSLKQKLVNLSFNFNCIQLSITTKYN